MDAGAAREHSEGMLVRAEVTLACPRAVVWTVMTDVDRLAEIVRGIAAIEIVERPTRGLVGLRWRETRTLFGEPATVEKWITAAEENVSYTTHAEDGGFVFVTTHRLSEADGVTTLTGVHETRPQGLAARLKALPMVFFRGAIQRAIRDDLDDLKAAAEAHLRRGRLRPGCAEVERRHRPGP